MVRLELAELDGSASPERYEQAASTLRAWLEEGVLQRDEAPAYYLLRQRFRAPSGEMLERYALFGALRLQEPGTSVLPHEATGAAAKEDRLALMNATEANLSPLFMLFRDDGAVAAVRNRAMARPPEAELGVGGEEFALWRIDDERDVEAIMLSLGSKQAFIADGHHRYETALNYQREHPDDAARFVMTCLVSFDDPGLLILPYGRVVTGLDAEALSRVRERVSALFAVRPVAFGAETAGPLEELVAQEAAEGIAFGMVGPGGEGPYLLTIRDPGALVASVPQGTDPSVAQVEAWVLQEAVLRPALGDAYADHVAYVHDGAAALDAVRSGPGQLAFFLKGVPANLFEHVVARGVRLPRKSTYFWPKLPSGLVINSLQGER